MPAPSEIWNFTTPQTTISPDYRKIAECAADLLDGWLDGKKQRPETVLDYHLIVRESTPETAPAGYKRK